MVKKSPYNILYSVQQLACSDVLKLLLWFIFCIGIKSINVKLRGRRVFCMITE